MDLNIGPQPNHYLLKHFTFESIKIILILNLLKMFISL